MSFFSSVLAQGGGAKGWDRKELQLFKHRRGNTEQSLGDHKIENSCFHPLFCF